MSAMKKWKLKTVNYYISKGNDMGSESECSGRLRSGLLGNQFMLYDNGLKPRGLDTDAPELLRNELAGVVYKQSGARVSGPRNLLVVVPRVMDSGKPVVFKPPATKGLQESYESGMIEDIVVLVNRPPVWNEEIGSFVLNFHGRVTKASIKNFQLVLSKDHSEDLLQFGRVGPNDFTMDFKYPLSPLQAFGICLSSFDNKLILK